MKVLFVIAVLAAVAWYFRAQITAWLKAKAEGGDKEGV